MQMRMFAISAAVLVLSAGAATAGPTIFGLTQNDRLVSFDASAPNTLLTNAAITGLNAQETIVGIDFRPATGALYGVTDQNRLVTLDAAGVATPVGGTTTPFTLNGARFGVDFNPVPDRIRVVSDTNQSLRLNPNNGNLGGTDTNLAYDVGDVQAGNAPFVVAAGYTNSPIGGPAPASTTLYGIDARRNALVRIGSLGGSPISPNAGTLFTVGNYVSLTNSPDVVGFDIFSQGGTDTGYLSTVALLGFNAFYMIDLATGANAFQGNPGQAEGLVIRDIAAIPAPGAIALLGLGGLVIGRRRR